MDHYIGDPYIKTQDRTLHSLQSKIILSRSASQSYAAQINRGFGGDLVARQTRRGSSR